MITLDAVRSALSNADPHTALDRLVRAELAAGRTTADVYTELLPATQAVRPTPGLSADARAALTGTLDALTGDCDPDQQYQDPPLAVARPDPHGRQRLVASSPSLDERIRLHLERRAVRKRQPAPKPAKPTWFKLSWLWATPKHRPVRPHRVTIFFVVDEPRGIQLLSGRARPVHQPTFGGYSIPTEDLALLAAENVPFAFVGSDDE